jgi:para-nitrobenzyl esterase
MSASLLIALAMLVLPAQDPDRPVVATTSGPVAGVHKDGVRAFKGLPYAAPPVGDLRWAPPARPEGWSEPRDASTVGALCIQPPANGDPGVGPMPMSEDCLTLNVWAPADARDLPVMVWIHGGGYNNGSGTAALYDGTALARRDVVVVTVNYRLGRLGFFDHPALAADRPSDRPAGNYGVMDQIAALEWVRDNVAAFGGDPGNVTIFGESAGGVAVTQLMIAPSARGLFHRAAVQSGLGRQVSAELALDRPGRPSAQSLGRSWARSAGLPADIDAAALRAVPAEKLLSPMPAFYSDNLIVDGHVLAEDVVEAFEAGHQAPVPLLLGTNSAEFWWIRPTDAGAYGRDDDALTEAEHDALLAAYGSPQAYDQHVVSDLIFNEPVRHLARLHARAGHPTWLYRFDVVPDSNPEPSGGATHASERPYVFETLHTVGRPLGARDHRASAAMAGYWTAFARSGDPNGDGRPEWPDFRRRADFLMEFRNDGPAAGAMPHATRLDLIATFRDRTR